MVELELLQRPERSVAHLRELELPLSELTRHVEPVVGGRRLAEVRQGDEDHAADREERSEYERQAHRSVATPAAAYRVASRRCSRASGHSAITEPSRKTKPASQIRLTSGFTKTRK